MSKLDEVEKELYGKEKSDDEALESRRRWHIFFPRVPRRLPTSWVGQSLESPREQTSARHWGRYFFLGTLFFLMVLGAVFVFFYLRTQGQEAKIEIQGNDNTESGETFTIPIIIKNISRSVLKDGEVAITLPVGTLLREGGRDSMPPPRLTKHVEDLQPQEQRVVEITVRLFGKEAQEQHIEAVYLYRPEHLRARFSAHTERTVHITKVPLALSWEVPDTLSRGQEVEIQLHYILSSRLPFEKVAMRLEYPSGFTFLSADPKPHEDTSIWELGTLEPGREGIIMLRGAIIGEQGEIKSFRASLGAFDASTKEWHLYAESSREIKIAVIPLSVEGFLEEGGAEGIISPGNELRFVIRYRNNTAISLKNITVRALVEGSILEKVSLSPAEKGVVEFKTGAVVWGPGNVADLREVVPGGGGELKLNIRTKDTPSVRDERDKNLTVTLSSFIDIASIPAELKGTDLHSEDHKEFKVASKVVLSGKSIYGSSRIPNIGPLPPRVGEKTTYTIVWEVKNFTNDMDSVEIVASLPPNVNWENNMITEGPPITYEPASGQVHWRIGMIRAGTGVLTPTMVGMFQVSITPAEVDRGKRMTLISASKLHAIDKFTGESVERVIKELTTELYADPVPKTEEWVVH